MGFTENQIKVVDNNKSTGRGCVVRWYFAKMQEIFDVLDGVETHKNNDEQEMDFSKIKRRRIELSEPSWSTSFREEAAQRHQERMDLQNKFLNMFQEWVNKEIFKLLDLFCDIVFNFKSWYFWFIFIIFTFHLWFRCSYYINKDCVLSFILF